VAKLVAGRVFLVLGDSTEATVDGGAMQPRQRALDDHPR